VLRRRASVKRDRDADLEPSIRFGANLRAARLARDLSQADMADLAGMRFSTKIPGIEAGRSDLRLSTAQRLADALGVPLSDLLK
jgi:transcriptional regulator with XRE-family HTH domain